MTTPTLDNRVFRSVTSEMLSSTILGSPVTVEVSAWRGNNSDLVPSSIADPKTLRMQGKVAR